ncbi:MAG: 4,5-DOPA dioxygenase extradiol [Prevotella sp.]
MEKDINPIMPALFLGHGSPMNAIENNVYTAGFEQIAKELPTPKAILCISAHWETHGTFVTAMDHPKTIHDFGGFPLQLYRFEYPAPGNRELAEWVQKTIKSTHVGLSNDWGLDHGCWSVVKYLYPKANVPIVELSIDYTKPAAYHDALAKELAALRSQGIMIIGSGNIVHNLRRINWDHMEDPGYGYDWAVAFNDKIKKMIVERDDQQLLTISKNDESYHLAAPSPEHFLPLLYILGVRSDTDKLLFFNDSLIGGSMSMTSLLFQS